MGKSREGQSILDYAIQEFGSIEKAIQIIQKGGLSLTSDIPAGIDLKLDTKNNTVPAILDFYSKKQLVPNNAAPIVTGDAYSNGYSNGYN